MVKKKTARQKVKDKTAKIASIATRQENASTPAQESLIDAENKIEQLPQNVKRKFAKKMRFYAKVQETHHVLGATKSISKKQRHRNRSKVGRTLNDLSSLAEFLPTFNDEITVPQTTAVSKLNCKSRQKLVGKETQQLAAVLSHPQFQSNPFSAIQQHLENTIGLQIVTEVKPKHGGKKESSQGSRKRKGSKVAPQRSVQAMDL